MITHPTANMVKRRIGDAAKGYAGKPSGTPRALNRLAVIGLALVFQVRHCKANAVGIDIIGFHRLCSDWQ